MNKSTRTHIRRIIRRWIINVFVAIDQLGNALSGGDPDETVSSRLGKEQGNPFASVVCWLLSLLDADHCQKAIEEDEGDDEPLRQ